jgi:hypothetical protein
LGDGKIILAIRLKIVNTYRPESLERPMVGNLVNMVNLLSMMLTSGGLGVDVWTAIQ